MLQVEEIISNRYQLKQDLGDNTARQAAKRQFAHYKERNSRIITPYINVGAWNVVLRISLFLPELKFWRDVWGKNLLSSDVLG